MSREIYYDELVEIAENYEIMERCIPFSFCNTIKSISAHLLKPLMDIAKKKG